MVRCEQFFAYVTCAKCTAKMYMPDRCNNKWCPENSGNAHIWAIVTVADNELFAEFSL